MNAHMAAALALCLLLGAPGCRHRPPDVDPAAAIRADAQGVTIRTGAPQWQFVAVANAEAGEPLLPLPLPAHVDFDPKRTAAIGVPLPGRVETVLVRVGSHVTAGERLFAVNSGAFAELDRDLEVARAQLEARQRIVARAQGLYELRAVAEKDLLAAEADRRETELAVRTAEARRQSLAVEADGDHRYWVLAPRAGTVVELDLAPGEQTGPDRERPALRLCDLDEVLVVADVPESDVRDVHVGVGVTIRPPFSAEQRAGTVEHVSEVLDPRRRTVEVWVRAANADRLLRPNSFVEVVFAADANVHMVRVPDAAVVTRGTQSVVFVATAADRLEPRPVQLGRRRGGQTEIRAGLAPGERFVARGALLLLNQVDLAAEL